jgi:hypothetical protein
MDLSLIELKKKHGIMELLRPKAMPSYIWENQIWKLRFQEVFKKLMTCYRILVVYLVLLLWSLVLSWIIMEDVP